MRRHHHRFSLGLIIILLTIAVGLPTISNSLPSTNPVRPVSAQEKGGVVAPKPRSTPRPSPRKSTSSGPSRTAPVNPRRSVPNIEMLYIQGGTFIMGSPDSERGRDIDEGPQHRVTVQQGFYMGKYEVTQAQWQAVMGYNPSHFSHCDNCPVENVSWGDAQKFIRTLNALDGKYTYRLPSEAEWEYACRAGTTTAFAFGDSLSTEQANLGGYHGDKTTPVGSFQPNRFGLYDMHGNVWEWCEDLYHHSYIGAPIDGGVWSSMQARNERVLRGGSWTLNDDLLRSASRGRYVSTHRSSEDGFRLAAVAR